ncbi:acyl-CoA dehydrogenase domain-containing protein [Tepidicaulis marinus]|uniref:Acyl-CoA dehydrogenase domain-containing protein n=1 Tax=Tepidicaulis marinus TaxID=1333998 RepID=A0A081BC59_9HYPH|nr:acyl-CoA dehydrogenase family protein [Tepidicaulis marinus]GAK45627.1 acyl-CoA dehydrogenase domain-containing protein [Tepidicaulis marinus]
MELAMAAEDAAFRDEVRAFLDTHLTDELREAGRLTTSVFTDRDYNLKWHKILYEKGWVAPNWPEEYGGTGWSEMQKYIWSSECARAQTPNLSPMGLRMCGPVIMKYGTQEQKDFYLPRILAGEDYWCQGYSEPGSGSDLASLQCKAVREGDEYVINGTKIWTTHAHFANRMFCLVRTDASGKPQQGITFLLIDMDTPGLKVEPILTMAGDHEVNQVFFDDVHVPVKNRVGEENDGWTVAKYLLEFERGGAYAAGLEVNIQQVEHIAHQEAADGGKLIDDPAFKAKLDDAAIRVKALEMTEHRIMSAMSAGQNPGPASSMLKAGGTELKQLIDTLAVEAIGYYMAPFEREAREPGSNIAPVGPDYALTPMATYLNNRASSIYGGSNEVQRNIMAKLVLGL